MYVCFCVSVFSHGCVRVCDCMCECLCVYVSVFACVCGGTIVGQWKYKKGSQRGELKGGEES